MLDFPDTDPEYGKKTVQATYRAIVHFGVEATIELRQDTDDAVFETSDIYEAFACAVDAFNEQDIESLAEQVKVELE